MLTVIVSDKAGQTQTLRFDKGEVTIGRIAGNDVVLPKSNVSKKHARIVLDHGRIVVVDAKSTNGTYVESQRIDGPYDLRAGERIFIGDFTLEVRATDAEEKRASDAAPAAEPGASAAGGGGDGWGSDQAPQGQWKDDWAKDDEAPAVGTAQVPDEVVELGRLAGAGVRLPAAAPYAGDGGVDLMVEPVRRAEPRPAPLPARAVGEPARSEPAAAPRAGEEARGVASRPAAPRSDAAALGPLADLLDDASVAEIFVDGTSRIRVEREGKLVETERAFSSAEAVLGALERLVAPLGLRAGEGSPLLDVRLPDGSRVSAAVAPVAVRGPCLVIRKVRRDPPKIDELVSSGTLTPAAAHFLGTCVAARKNVVVSGGSGSGKTTMVGVLARFIPSGERVVSVEEAAELELGRPDVVALEARGPDAGGKGAVGMRDLVRHALRMRPDRIVVGDCRGPEALDLLQAMVTGHDGTLTTVRAGTPREALSRIETMALAGGMDAPPRSARQQIARAVDVVVQLARFRDGSRRVMQIAEVTGMDGDAVTLRDVFVLERAGAGEPGVAGGRLVPTGVVPAFYDELEALGIDADLSIFRRG